MTIQSNTAELTFVDARSFAERDLDLGITMIEDTCVRMPYAAVGLSINPIHTDVVRMPYAAVSLAANTVQTAVVRMPYAAVGLAVNPTPTRTLSGCPTRSA
jgi:hypothetical protein